MRCFLRHCMICIIIHGCPSNAEKAMDSKTRTYDKHWRLWAKKDIEKKGFTVDAPLMPEPWDADYYLWKKEFEKLVVNRDSVLIGHSCGCSFLVRWLGETKKRCGKLILVAPWKIPYGNGQDLEKKKRFYEYKVDEGIRNRVKEIIIFTSDNEAGEGKESAEIFHRALGGEVISLSGRGHYTLKDMKTDEFPELIDAVLR